MKEIIFLLMLIWHCLDTNAQVLQQEENQEENKIHHRVSLICSHSYIPAVTEGTNNKSIFTAATLGVNYELWLNKKWAVGLHNDIIMESFSIEKEEDKSIVKKEFPVLTSLVAVYKPGNHWSWFAGPGKEFEKNENFNIIKTGIEYGIELSKKWEIGFGIDYDIKIKGYNSWLTGIGISRIF